MVTDREAAEPAPVAHRHEGWSARSIGAAGRWAGYRRRSEADRRTSLRPVRITQSDVSAVRARSHPYSAPPRMRTCASTILRRLAPSPGCGPARARSCAGWRPPQDADVREHDLAQVGALPRMRTCASTILRRLAPSPGCGQGGGRCERIAEVAGWPPPL